MEIPPVNVKSQFSHSESHLKMHVFHCQCRLSILLHPWILDPWNIMELNELVRCMVMCIRVSGALSFAFMCSEWMISIITMCSEWMISIITIHNLYIYVCVCCLENSVFSQDIDSHRVGASMSVNVQAERMECFVAWCDLR